MVAKKKLGGSYVKVYLDVDGVFADFDKKIAEIAPGHLRMSNEIWEPISKVPNFFATLELMHESLELINILKDYDLEFLTALPRPTGLLYTADSDKRHWLREHVSKTIPINTVEGGVNKVRWLKEHPGSILIDDYQRNIDLWEEHGGIGILFTTVPATIDKLIKRKIL
jgi:hypothetical protein